MHYYKFNIADWNLSTAHLTLEEEAIYFRLINHYYDTESPIPIETQSVIRRLRLGSDESTVVAILQEFFTKTDKGFVHSRCEEILKDYRKTIKNNRSNGARGGRPRNGAACSETQNKPSGFSKETEQEPKHNPNQEPLTTNHKPITNNQELKTYCSEPIVSEPEDPPVIEILTNKKNELARITHSQYDRWVETYPAVDVWQTLLRIKSWAEANPAKRKTNKGMARFIDSWLAREQDKPRVNPGGPGAPQAQFKNSREKNAERNAQIFDYNRAIDF